MNTCEICGKQATAVWNGVGRDHRECQRESWHQRNMEIVSRGVRIAVKLGLNPAEIVAAHEAAIAAGYGISVKALQAMVSAERTDSDGRL